MNRQPTQFPLLSLKRWAKSFLLLILTIILQGALLDCGKKERMKNITIGELNYFLDNPEKTNISSKYGGLDWLHVVLSINANQVRRVVGRINKDYDAGRDDQYTDGFPNTYDSTTQRTAIGKAIERGDLNMVMALSGCRLIDFNKAAKSKPEKESTLTDDISTILLALKKGNLDIAHVLFEEGTKPIPFQGKKTDVRRRPEERFLDLSKQDPDTFATALHLAISEEAKLPENKRPYWPRSLVLRLTQYLAEVVRINIRKKQDITRPECNPFLLQDYGGLTPLDVAASLHYRPAFDIIFSKMIELIFFAASNSQDSMPQIMDEIKHILFRDKKYDEYDANRFLFLFIMPYVRTRYSPAPKWIQKVISVMSSVFDIGNSTDNDNYLQHRYMFKHILTKAKYYLKEEDFQTITRQIDFLQEKGCIPPQESQKLRNILNQESSHRPRWIKRKI